MSAGPYSVPLIVCVAAPGSRIKGDFESDLPDMFDVEEGFAEVVVYKEDGQPDVAIKAMFDDVSTEIDVLAGDTKSSNPLIWFATDDAPDVTQKDTFVICGNTFQVLSVAPDGSGVTTVELTKDA
jgi:hypothetical protein